VEETEAERLREMWLDWLDKIETDVYDLHLNRERWTKLIEMGENVDPILEPWDFVRWVGGLYAIAQAVVIRRQSTTGDHISFGNLLRDIERHPEALTREWHIARYEPSPAPTWAADDFDKFAGTGELHVDPGIVRADHDALKAISRKIITYVDKFVAHIDATPPLLQVTYGDLHEVLDEFDRLLKRYVLLLRAAGLITTTPVDQSDWTLPFYRAWLQDPVFEDWYKHQKDGHNGED
jgi:hypothetical protein